MSYFLQEDEGDASGGVSDRDSDAEFEQMLAEAEEANKISAEADDDDVVAGDSNVEEESAGSGDTPTSSQAPNQTPVRRKAKTKIGNKSKKKKKTKTTSKFPGGDGEDGYEVCNESLTMCRASIDLQFHNKCCMCCSFSIAEVFYFSKFMDIVHE
jgi:chromodomain-helicase-DNA-binding protein 4